METSLAIEGNLVRTSGGETLSAEFLALPGPDFHGLNGDDDGEEIGDWQSHKQWHCTNCSMSTPDKEVHCIKCNEQQNPGKMEPGFMASSSHHSGSKKVAGLGAKEEQNSAERSSQNLIFSGTCMSRNDRKIAIGRVEDRMLGREESGYMSPGRQHRLRAVMSPLETSGLQPTRLLNVGTIGTPRRKKQLASRRFYALGIGIILCILTGYQIAIHKYPGRKSVLDGPGDHGTISLEAAQPEGFRSTSNLQGDDLWIGNLNASNETSRAKRAANEVLRMSEFCSNNCNTSDIYQRLWLEARIQENRRIFQASEDPDDAFRESVETNVMSKDFQLVIKVLAYNRLESLARCLTSLARADYGGDSVKLQIYLDHFPYDGARADEDVDYSAYVFDRASKPVVDVLEDFAPVEEFLDAGRVDERGRRLLWDFGFTKSTTESAGLPTSEDDNDVAPNTRELGERLGLETIQSAKGDMESSSQGEQESSLDTWSPEDFTSQISTHEMPMQSTPNAAIKNTLAGDEFAKEQVKRQTNHDETLRATRRSEVKSLDAELEEAHDILRYVDAFIWTHGLKEIHYRSQNAGLQAQWVEAWWPTNTDEFAFVVEDDMEVNNMYYRFLRMVIATYYYNPEQYDPSVYGVSLQRPRFVPGRGGQPLKVNSTKNLFMFPMVGTWGQLLFPQQWKEFRLWYDAHKSKGEMPFLDGMKTNSWYKKLGEKIWTPWFVKFVHCRGYFNLYTNFMDERALSVSHRDAGVNYKDPLGPDSRLLYTMEEGNDTMLWVMSPSQSLLRYDYCFREVKSWKVATTVLELREFISSIEVKKTIVMVNIVEVPDWLVKNWLCHMERLGLRKFVILGDDDGLIRDLARRGYATMSTQIFTELQDDQIFTNLRRDVVAVQAVHGLLNLGYSVWLSRADTVWVHNPLLPTTFDSTEFDFLGVEPVDRFHPALLYIHASQGVLRLWGKLVKNLLVIARDSGNKIEESIWLPFPEFVNSMKNCHYKTLPILFGGFEDSLTSKVEGTAASKTVILLDRLGDRIPSDVITRLKAAGLWIIDKDLACKRVYCQPEKMEV